MISDLKEQIHSYVKSSLLDFFPSEDLIPSIEIEIPADKAHGDFSTNIALKSAKLLRKAPITIAADFQRKLAERATGLVEKVEVKAPGFINFFLNPVSYGKIVPEVFMLGDNFGRGTLGKGKKIQIEFVSANPKGPLNIAHGRQAAVGDALGNILRFMGFDVTKEYYINDAGNQVYLLGQSIKCRALESFGGTMTFPENGYLGDYIKDMAKIFCDENNLKDLASVEKVSDERWIKFGIEYSLDIIRKDLEDFGVHFDVWSSESKIATRERTEKTLLELKNKGEVYELEGAWWLKSTAYGDDKDRVVKKTDGSFTYLAPDIVYHKDKFERGFTQVFNIWGPDHHGYIARLKASIKALGNNPDNLEVLIVQLATIYRDGKPVSMSTRKGEFITLREVIEEVGVDATRFFFLMRQIKSHLDFDLELAKKQTPENPVYYIQYAHARVHSINKKAEEAGGIPIEKKSFTLLTEPEEVDLIKQIGLFNEAQIYCYEQRDPYPLTSYLVELATTFHRFYDKHRIIGEDKKLSAERLGLVNATGIVIANGLRLLGVSTPEKM